MIMTAPSAPTCTAETRLFGTLVYDPSDTITFPDGLPGFPEVRSFALLSTPVEPLVWLQSLDRPELAFLLVRPEAAGAGVEVVPETWRRHGLFAAAVVTLPGPGGGHATANLKAPVVVDRAARTGRQMILPESPFGTAHPFDLAALAGTPA
jgi:flagellar assembly factor FliW